MILSLKEHLTKPQTRPNIFICSLDQADEAPLANIKIERQRWPAPFFTMVDQNLAYLPTYKTGISLEQKEISENSKQHSSSRTDYLFMFRKGLDEKDENFLTVAL